MSYLAKWRLKLAAEKLRSTDDSVAQIAAAVGYGSEATLTRTFKREFAYPPAQFRRKHKGPALRTEMVRLCSNNASTRLSSVDISTDLSGLARLCAEKLRFSEALTIIPAAVPPPPTEREAEPQKLRCSLAGKAKIFRK